jgi:hypothetical protein
LTTAEAVDAARDKNDVGDWFDPVSDLRGAVADDPLVDRGVERRYDRSAGRATMLFP